jgi:hypothetical protein
MKKIFDKENLIFGLIWGVLVIFLAGFLVKAIDIIQKVMDTLLEWALKAFVFPALLADYLKFSGTFKYALIFVLTVLAAPLARKAFNWLRRLFKKSPV